MSIDHESETLVPFHQARSAFPGRKKLALQTLHRWRLHGVRGVKLETVLVGGLRFTSLQAISRFISAQNSGGKPATAVSPKQRRTQTENAIEILKAKGI